MGYYVIMKKCLNRCYNRWKKVMCKIILLCNVQKSYYYLKIIVCVCLFLHISVQTLKKKGKEGHFWGLKLEIGRNFQILLSIVPKRVEAVGLWVIFYCLFVPLQHFPKFLIINLCCFYDQASFLQGSSMGMEARHLGFWSGKLVFTPQLCCCLAHDDCDGRTLPLCATVSSFVTQR